MSGRAARRAEGAPSAAVAAVLLIVVVLSGCSDASPSAVDPHSPEARRIASLWWLMFGLGGAIYLVVVALVVVSLRDRRRRTDDEPVAQTPDPGGDRRSPNTRFILIGGLLVPSIALGIVGVETVRATNAVANRTGEVHVDVIAERWWWRVSYPDQRVVTANEIHVPTGVPVDLVLRSADVIHSLWVPQLNGKTDVIPGQTNHMTFTADDPGTYRGQCAEFCGIGHALMSFVVVAQSPAEFDDWLTAQRQAPAAPATDDAVRGERVFQGESCAGCHTVQGTAAVGTFGPDLTHFGSRASIAANTLPNTPDALRHWLADTQGVKHGALMPQTQLSADELRQLVAYLEGLK